MNLKKRLKYWQKRLGLQDWHITISWKKFKSGEADFKAHITHREARIRINPKQLRSGWRQKKLHNYDAAIVHELLHLHLHQAKFAEEQVINAITLALMKGR